MTENELLNHEGIKIPQTKIAYHEDHPYGKFVDNISPYKQMNSEENSSNTLGKAKTYFKSAESSESILRTSSSIFGTSSNVKTYILNKSRKLISNLNRSEKDCTLCNKLVANKHHNAYKNQINKNLQKYKTNNDYYNLIVTNDLLYNGDSHIVSVFKDYLLFDD
jgi:hypothetical protein